MVVYSGSQVAHRSSLCYRPDVHLRVPHKNPLANSHRFGKLLGFRQRKRMISEWRLFNEEILRD